MIFQPCAHCGANTTRPLINPIRPDLDHCPDCNKLSIIVSDGATRRPTVSEASALYREPRIRAVLGLRDQPPGRVTA